MNELENRHRKYLGLAETDHSWIRVEVKEHVIYHNGVHVLKHISNNKEEYFECDLNEPVPDRFNKTEISKFKSCGVYFSYCKPHVKIGNINSQRTFIEDETADLDTWLDRWISDSTDADLDELKKFSSAARCRQKYREGDFFAFKLSRRSWGFGRIIYDIGKRRKTEEFIAGKNYGLANLMGHALVIQVYHYTSSTPDVSIDMLKGKKMLPSQPVFDNRFLYGDYRIIGNAPVEESEIIPIESYGRSLDRKNEFYYLQYGLTYCEKKLPPSMVTKTYRNESIGFRIHTSEKLIQSCIESGNNDPYWAQDLCHVHEDLRNPANLKDRRLIFRHFGLHAAPKAL